MISKQSFCVVVAGYELALTFVRKAAFARKIRRRRYNVYNV